MVTLQQFVTYAVVAAGSNSKVSRARALVALEGFPNQFGQSEQRHALGTARAGIEQVRLRGSLADQIFFEIDHRLSGLVERS